MLDRKYKGMLLLSVLGASADFFMFPLFATTAFAIHNMLALSVGVGIIWISLRLIQKKAGDSSFHYLCILVGLSMISVHLTKLFVGR